MNQPLPLVEQLRNLELLQELDLKIDSLKKHKNSLPAHLKSIDESLHKLKTSIESKKAQFAEIEKVYRQANAALDLNRDRLARSNSKLEAVQNAQEFQAANKEIEQLKKLNVSLEEQSKKAGTELEGVQKELDAFNLEFEKIQGERDAQQTVLSGQDTQFKTDIDGLMSERQKYTAHIEAKVLALYDRVRSARGGLGIVPAIAGRCKGCNMVVPPQLYNEVQRGVSLQSCPSCHRLLFMPSKATVPAADPTTDPGAVNELNAARVKV